MFQKYKLLFWALPLLLMSCFPSNEIYFDIKAQTVKSCNREGIRHLEIKSDSINEDYFMRYKESLTANAPKEIYIDSVDTRYVITSSGDEISNAAFKLKPLSKYTITRMQGDAGPYSIEVSTDTNGKVVQASRISKY